MQHACLLGGGGVGGWVGGAACWGGGGGGGEVEVDLSLCCSQKEAGVEEEGKF